MKRILFMAAIIGLFMATTMDLQARHRRNDQPRHVRGGISIAPHRHISLHNQYNRYDHYQNRQRRQIVREIRRNEKRIWKLEKRMDRLGRHRGNYREIRELEQEIYRLERRNDDLRRRLY